MAFGKNSRVDTRRPASSYCSTATIVVFVTLCLIGVWMMTSSTVVPVKNVDTASSETNTELKQQVDGNDSQRFEDSSGDVNDDSVKGETNYDVNPVHDSQAAEVNEGQDQPMEGEKPVDGSKIDAVELKEGIKENSKETTKEDVEQDGHVDTGGEGGQQDGEEKESQDGSKSDSEEKEPMEEEKKEELVEIENRSENKKKSNSEDGEHDVEEQSLSEDDKKEPNPEESSGEKGNDDEEKNKEEEVIQNQEDESEKNSNENKIEDLPKEGSASEMLPAGAQSEILNETTTQNGAFSTQAMESKHEKEGQEGSRSKSEYSYNWKLCNVTAGADYIPCLDNEAAIKKLRSTKHYEHRERHCPEENPTCLVSFPEGYKRPVSWPNSRNKIWYNNVPHPKLVEVKGHQNWVKVNGEFLTFPGGGTQFKHGALHYIDFIQETLPDIAWGKQSRVVLDVGCGVASLGGFLFDRDVLTMSFAPKDEHEAQVQFALERGIPAISAVMGTTRLPFPSKVFDVVHCARCRVPWHIEGGKLLLELNRLLRPGGYFLWSATPVYRKLPEDVAIWQAMSSLTKTMCWERVAIKQDSVNQVGIAIYKKPSENKCYDEKAEANPPICPAADDPNAAWNIPLQACMHRVPESAGERGAQWPELWPKRLDATPYWLTSSQVGAYGKPAPEDFTSDNEHWKHVVSKSYISGLGIDWSTVRNVMDMRAVYGGFAAALKDMKVWVMNVVSIDAPDTLPVIYERGLFGIYHDWCQSFSTYPRTYDLLHADHLFSKLKTRCQLTGVMAEVDRILRPEGKLIVRDNVDIVNEIENMAKSLQWEIRMTYSKDKEGLLCVQKTFWRPQEIEKSPSSSSQA